jgi:acyl transferase domain-containing protein/SAM-dependent methyltransferase/acyl carrier protein
MPLEELVQRLGANDGYLLVALRLLESMGWVSRSCAGLYGLTPLGTDQCVKVPEQLLDMLSFPMSSYLSGKSGELTLSEWFERSRSAWDAGDDALLPVMLDGMFIVPLLAAVHQSTYYDGSTCIIDFSRMGARARIEVQQLFLDKGWCRAEGDCHRMTEAGKFMLDSGMRCAMVVSYAPMLKELASLLAGDCSNSFPGDEEGKETYGKPILNIVSGGFQHDQCFREMDEALLQIFNALPVDAQPDIVVDVGCGDGTLLKRIHHLVMQSERGKFADTKPVTLIGVDFKHKALHAATTTLADIPHRILRGDIHDPHKIEQDLEQHVPDVGQVLYVRSFLGQDRPFLVPADQEGVARRRRLNAHCVSVDRTGASIAPEVAVQSLVEHLSRWAQLRSRHGTLVLEQHCLAPEISAGFLMQSENLHVDALHAFSQQHLVEAHTFLGAAAEAGLVALPSFSGKYPKDLPYARITLSHFQARRFRIRMAGFEDLAQLQQLESSRGAGSRRASGPDLASRIRSYPEGQMVLEEGGEIKAAVYSRRVPEEDRDAGLANGFHGEPGGEIVELLYAAGPDPELRDELMAFMRQYCAAMGGVANVVMRAEVEDAAAVDTPPSDATHGRLPEFIRSSSMRPQNDTLAAELILHDVAIGWALHALRARGALRHAGERWPSVRALAETLGVLPKYMRLFDALIRQFVQRKLVGCDGDGIQVYQAAIDNALVDPEARFERLSQTFEEKYPEALAYLRLLGTSMPHFGAIISGEKTANEVIFADGSVELFGGLFGGTTISDYYNSLVAEIAHERLAGHPGEATSAPFRILEIGAGTGGGTVDVLERLAGLADRFTFDYTDISSTFVRYGRKRFAERYPNMRFEQLNIEDDPAGQGFEQASFDLVLASNVVHDTHLLHNALVCVNDLLKPGGRLVMNEFTAAKGVLMFTGGLLHGYWLFQDPELRLPDCCLLTVPQWRHVLEAAGFDDIQAYGLPFEQGEASYRQSVISAAKCRSVAKRTHGGGQTQAPASVVAAAREPAPPAVMDRAPDTRDPRHLATLMAIVESIVGSKRMARFMLETPFMESGIDSLELLELRTAIGAQFGWKLDTSFLFEYNTGARVLDYIARHHGEAGGPLAAAPAVPALPKAAPGSGSGSRPADAAPATQADDWAIAVVGMSLRFPGNVENAAGFWELLCAGRSAIRQWPDGRSGAAGVDQAADPAHLARGGFLDRIDEFDPEFFRLSPLEAELMDPQQRMLLQLAWAALEDSGVAPSSLVGSRTGVYVGGCHFDYRHLLERSGTAYKALTATGGSSSMLANRISYFLDLKGPSLFIDTACSSSLVAIDMAVRDLRAGACQRALAGGINLIADPAFGAPYAQAGMLSPDAQCFTFDSRANGYVRGEGGAFVVLKKLSDAIRDGDPIHGIVRGSAVNHGGMASSLTAPNPQAQAALITNALEDARVDGATIAYVEAHGTGTRLGDPIEIQGLGRALGSEAAPGSGATGAQACGLGSVKTNIGHLEGAAGIAGFIKVLLCLQHRVIPPTLNFNRLNPELDLGSKFFVASSLKEWAPFRNGRGEALPLRAGISSFGFGGANAHAILEEYIPAQTDDAASGPAADMPIVVVLSAKNPARLKESAEQLLAWVKREAPSRSALIDMAYTLQVARTPMDERLALAVDTADALVGHLSAFLDGQTQHGEVARGHARRGADPVSVLAGDEDMATLVDAWVAKGKYGKLLDMWTKGLAFDWNRLYGAVKPKRISLPTYPFARERFWVPDGPAASAPQPAASAMLHPLLHSNTSDFEAQRFTSTFSGAEFFLADHLVQGSKVLPGVAHLEMALQALRRASRTQDAGTVHLRDVVWMRPVVVGDRSEQVHIGLTPLGDTRIGYEIVADAPGDRAGTPVFSQGVGLLDLSCDTDSVRLGAVRAECTALVSGQEYYGMLERMGLVYGPRFQSVQSVQVGTRVAVARLVLPAGAEGPYALNPSMMDGALQASIVLLGSEARSGKTYVPFAFEALDVLQPCPASMWAVVRSRGAVGDPACELDIELCGEAGDLCARIRGLKFRALNELGSQAGNTPHAVPVAPQAAAQSVSASATLAPVWSVLAPDDGAAWPAAQERVLVVGGSTPQQEALLARYPSTRVLALPATATLEAIQAALQAQDGIDHLFIDHLFWIAPDEAPGLEDDGLIEAQQRGVLACLRVVKALLALGYGARPLGWTIVTAGTQAVLRHETVRAAHASVHGLAGSMAKEYPGWKVRLLDLQADAAWPLEALLRLPADAHGNALAFRQGKWYRQQLLASEVALEGKSLYRQGGVYVVIGGAGGIGVAWTGYMMRNYGAQVVWIGRRALDATIEAQLSKLTELSAGSAPAPHYIAADATDRVAMERARDEIKLLHGRIDGVVHAAIVLADKSLAQMDEVQFQAALAAKVDTSVRLAQVFGGEALDFVLFFSSILSNLKAPGQSNYAAGCTFKDAFAQQLRGLCPCAVKVINWGYWGSVGIVASPAYRERMAQMGFGSIEPEEGMAALETLIGGALDQMTLLKWTKPMAAMGISETAHLRVFDGASACPGRLLDRSAQTAVLAQAQQQASVLGALGDDLCRLLYAQLRATGLLAATSFDLGVAMSSVGMGAQFRPWLDESLKVLASKGYLDYDGWRCVLSGKEVPAQEAAWREWETSRQAQPADAGADKHLRLLDTVLRALPAILTGASTVTEVLFPDSSMVLLEGIYRGNPISDYYNTVLGDVLVAHVQERLRLDPSARIRIMEIGAGTGGTSAMLFQRLRPYQAHVEEYCYTDLSRAFLFHAEQSYGPEIPI